MDAELREAFREIKTSIDKIDGKLSSHLEQFQVHCVEDAKIQQQILLSCQDAHKRLEEHGAEHANERSGRFQLWLGVVLAFVSAVFASLFALIRGGKQ